MCMHVEGYADYRGVKRGDLLLLKIMAERSDQTGVDVADLDRFESITGYPRKTLEASLRRLVRKGKLRRLTDDEGRITGGNVWHIMADMRGPWHLYRVGWFNENGEPIK